jgi:probable H4MPT-linked C1 transfer pathway protein
MPSEMLTVAGWDIGGVNIKAGRLLWQNKEIVDMKAVSHPFEIWLKRDRISDALRAVGNELDLEGTKAMAVTMTAELSDAFRSKRDGVVFILDAIEQAFPNIPFYLLNLSGDLVQSSEARQHPLDFAATNWFASALLVADKHRDCILVDVGSTTTDIIPIRRGRVIAKGFTDLSRLASGELVYTGVQRTNPNTVSPLVPLQGKMCRVSAEYFTIMGDIYLLLGYLSSESYTSSTPDGRTKSLDAARERLARLICADCDMLSEEELFKLARYLFEKQLQQVAEALFQVLSRLEIGYRLPLAVAGSGSFLAAEIGRRLGMKIVDMGKEWGEKEVAALPSLAVAFLLAKQLEAKRQ